MVNSMPWSSGKTFILRTLLPFSTDSDRYSDESNIHSSLSLSFSLSLSDRYCMETAITAWNKLLIHIFEPNSQWTERTDAITDVDRIANDAIRRIAAGSAPGQLDGAAIAIRREPVRDIERPVITASQRNAPSGSVRSASLPGGIGACGARRPGPPAGPAQRSTNAPQPQRPVESQFTARHRHQRRRRRLLLGLLIPAAAAGSNWTRTRVSVQFVCMFLFHLNHPFIVDNRSIDQTPPFSLSFSPSCSEFLSLIFSYIFFFEMSSIYIFLTIERRKKGEKKERNLPPFFCLVLSIRVDFIC